MRRAELPEGHLERSRLLDKPSTPNALLSLLMDEALTRIMLVSDGAVMPLTEHTTGAYADTRAPSSDLAVIIGGLADRFGKCRTHRARLLVIKDAQDVGDRLKYAPRSEQRGTREWKETIAADERSCRVVATVYRVSLRDVVAYRKTFRVTKVAI